MNDRLTHIEEQIAKKTACLPDGVQIHLPESGIPVEKQADWLTYLLCRMYIEHGITKRRDQLIQSIESGDCRTWFATKDGKPVGSAALVKQSDGTVEVGRAVAVDDSRAGALLMYMAARDHWQNSKASLVAEVRISREFAGIPSGEATQTICLSHLGLNPHALVPAFNHGRPVRQEEFLFSSSQTLGQAESVCLPDDRTSMNLLCMTAIALASGSFHQNMRITESSNHRAPLNWNLETTVPFSVVAPSNGSGTRLETALGEAEKQTAFTLLPVEATGENASALIECLNLGFTPMGIDRNVGSHGHPILLLGKLRSGTLLAPTEFVDGVLPQDQLRAARRIDRAFRQSVQV